MKTTKKSKPFDRAAMKDLSRPQSTIIDYAKASPISLDKASPNIIQNYRKIRR